MNGDCSKAVTRLGCFLFKVKVTQIFDKFWGNNEKYHFLNKNCWGYFQAKLDNFYSNNWLELETALAGHKWAV